MELGPALAEQERAWNERPPVRRQYEWYRAIVAAFADVPRPTVELGDRPVVVSMQPLRPAGKVG